MRFHLASTSPARLMLLQSAGIEPALIDPAVDEHAVRLAAETAAGAALSPAVLVQLLARAKAEAASARLDRDEPTTDGLVLGGDSVFVLDDEIYGKPHTPEAALERWHHQRGRTGQLFSGHWLIDRGAPRGADAADAARAPARAVGAVAVAEVTFTDDITDAELHAYIATGEPLFVAGAFTIDSLGAPFIERIVGDPSTVVGLSLPTLRRLVVSLGHEWTSLWNRPTATSL